jgi:cytochrome c oxidase subunit 2
MKFKYLYVPLICLSFLNPTNAISQGDPIKGKSLYTTCAACHGQNGEGLQATNSPRLAGLHDWYLLSQLRKFRSGLRGANAEDIYGAQMVPLANALPNEQALLNVVAYIVTLKADRPPRTETSGNMDPIRAQAIKCWNCHGTNGQGLKEAYKGIDGPRLSGQHDWYLIRQLKNFKAGIRGDLKDKAGLEMRVRAKLLMEDDQMIKDIVAYIGTLE